MTKTLTEQWREGTIPSGGYYIKLLDGSIKQTDYDNIRKTFDTKYFQYNISVKEVLAPVDGYSQLVSKTEQLEKKLAIATKALKDVSLSLWDEMECRSCADKALKEMEGVK